jgi:aspartate kinase
MKLLVMKFGGASVANPKNFSRIAEIITERSKKYLKVCVVVSAMGNMTDQLLSLARETHPHPPKREQDMLVSVGERISISLLAMALDRYGKKAISFTGSQSGIITCARHAEARIIDVRPFRLFSALQENKIVIVAGFQGVNTNGEITTLGRGGSDTSAVALGVSLGAEKIEFYKDVAGMYDEDPKRCAQAKFYRYLDYNQAEAITTKNNRILHPRCIQLAKKNAIRLHVLSYEEFTTNESINQLGTRIAEDRYCDKKSYESMEGDLLYRESIS